MNNWDKLKRILKQIGHGEVRIKIENGEPTYVPEQVISKSSRDKIMGIKIIKEGIDLTKTE